MTTNRGFVILNEVKNLKNKKVKKITTNTLRKMKKSGVVADMPFLSYHVSKEEAVRNAGKLIQEGLADAVKMEGGTAIFETMRHVIDANIPVVGHLGLTPQSVLREGGYFIKGKAEKEIQKLKKEALQMQEMGIVALTLESMIAEVAKEITESLDIPVIGIGAGKDTDGQVLVYHDIIGYYHGYIPKFVKQYANVSEVALAAAKQYIADVKSGAFPDEEHTFTKK